MGRFWRHSLEPRKRRGDGYHFYAPIVPHQEFHLVAGDQMTQIPDGFGERDLAFAAQSADHDPYL